MDNRYHRHNRRKYHLNSFIADDTKSKIFNIINAHSYETTSIEINKDHIYYLSSYNTMDKSCNIIKIIKINIFQFTSEDMAPQYSLKYPYSSYTIVHN